MKSKRSTDSVLRNCVFLWSFIHRERPTSKSVCKRMPSIVPQRFNTAVYLKRMHEGIEARSRHVDTLIPVGLNDPWMITSWNTEKTVAWCLPFRLCSLPIFSPTWDSRGDYFAYTTTVEALKQLWLRCLLSLILLHVSSRWLPWIFDWHVWYKNNSARKL